MLIRNGGLNRRGTIPGAVVQPQEFINGIKIDDLIKRDGASVGIAVQSDLVTDRWLNKSTNTLLGVDAAGGGGMAQSFSPDGEYLTGIGWEALRDIEYGHHLTAVGSGALRNITDFSYTTAVGSEAGGLGAEGSQSSYFGAYAGYKNDGSNVTAIGFNTLVDNITGQYNTALGSQAGEYAASTLDGCLYLGYRAGRNNTISDSMWIHNSESTSPLISGKFDTRKVNINLGPDGSKEGAALTVHNPNAGPSVFADSYTPLAGVSVVASISSMRRPTLGATDGDVVFHGFMAQNDADSLVWAGGVGGRLTDVSDGGEIAELVFSVADGDDSPDPGNIVGILNSSGHFGLNTSPVSNLHVHTLSGNGSYARFTNSDSGATATDGMLFGIDSAERGAVWLYENNDIYFGTNNAERFRIKNNGRISINAGASPLQAVDLRDFGPTIIRMSESTASSYVGLLWSNDSNSIAMYYGGTTQGSISNTWSFYVNSSHQGYVFKINGSGYVGIGQDIGDPQGAFQITSSGDSRVYLGNTPNLTVWNGYIRIMRRVNSSSGGIEVFDASGTMNQVVTWDGRGRLGVMTGLAGVPYTFAVNGEFGLYERSSDPANPAEGQSVIWMADGGGANGADGDLMIKVTAGGVTKVGTLFDFSAA